MKARGRQKETHRAKKETKEKEKGGRGFSMLPLVAAVFLFGVVIGTTMGHDAGAAPDAPLRRSLRGGAGAAPPPIAAAPVAAAPIAAAPNAAAPKAAAPIAAPPNAAAPRAAAPIAAAPAPPAAAPLEVPRAAPPPPATSTDRSRRVMSLRSLRDGTAYATAAAPLDRDSVSGAAFVYVDGADKSADIKTVVSNKETGCDVGDARDGYALAVNNWETRDGQLTLEWGDATTGCRKLASGPRAVVAPDRWTHVAFVLSPTTAALFVDGAEVARERVGDRRSPQRTQPLRVGQYADAFYPFVGNISGLVIFDGALTASDVRALAAASAPGAAAAPPRTGPAVAASFPLADWPGAKGANVAGDGRGLAYARASPAARAGAARAAPGGSFAVGYDAWEPTPEKLAASDATAAGRAAKVRDAMRHAWKGYKDRAWGRDELKPVSGRGHDNWGGMGVTLVDSLDTLWLMGLRQEFDEAKRWVRDSLRFDRTGDVSVFETTIRELGGLLAAFDLSGDKVFLDKARDLGQRLAHAFDTPTGIPKGSTSLREGRAKDVGWTGGNAVLAELGSVELEFRYLGYKLGDASFSDKANRVFEQFSTMKGTQGLFPIYVDPRNGGLKSRKITFGALGDSYYEYLLKTWLQGGRTETRLREMYDEAMDGMVDLLLQHSSPSNLAYVADIDGGTVHKMDHLVCFLGGVLALGAKTDPRGFDSPRARRDLHVAEALTHTCVQMYLRQPTKLAPEFVTFRRGADMVVAPSAPFYILRPETAESLFVLHEVTKNPVYRDWGWEIFSAIEARCRTAHGYGSVPDVRKVTKPDDRMESFFLAETLKYLYLLQDPNHAVDLETAVFNTEAHPLRNIGPGKYTSSRLTTG